MDFRKIPLEKSSLQELELWPDYSEGIREITQSCVNCGEEYIVLPCLNKKTHPKLLDIIEYQQIKSLCYYINATACIPVTWEICLV